MVFCYTGLADGRIVKINLKTEESTLFARTGEDLPNCGSYEVEHRCGRPLGMRFTASGSLLVADAYHGLLSVSPEGVVSRLTNNAAGRKCVFFE
eukprot:TRINITY_DN2281_c0_g1_i1.p1 TRINITY_DN2281_c0_g1~~TRINITY_DN2281_c0_g1_i1.p1  ORF type:complete len:94 (+),score=24.19 TRINITY_DN2281_c0_g1_i1:134-415(+)